MIEGGIQGGAPWLRGIEWRMALDFGQIRRRQDGRIYLDFGRTGKLYSAHGAPFRDEREAEHVLHAVRVAIARGVARGPAGI